MNGEPEDRISSSPRWLRAARVVFLVSFWATAGLLGVAAVLIGVAYLLAWISAPPSIETLASRFPAQRKDLETILVMAERDNQLTRIDPSWLMTRNRQFLGYSPETGITEERWNEYRQIFKRNGIKQGIQRDPETGDSFFIVDSIGILDRGHSNGFLHCGPGAKHVYPPCESTLAAGEHPYRPGDEAYSFQKLANGWYAYSEGPG
jgi:hypothetical protein